MSVDRLKLYKVELRPPKGWTKDKAKKYQGKLVISTKVESFPFLAFSDKLRPCDAGAQDKIRRRILDKRDPSLPLTEPLTPDEQKEFDGRVQYNCSWAEADDVLEKRGDEIVKLLKVVMPNDLLSKELVSGKYLKPLSPTSGRELVQFLHPSPPPIKLVKQEPKAWRTMTFVVDSKVFEGAIASDFNQLFISPWGDLRSPTGLVGLHRAIKESGLRVLAKIRGLENRSRLSLENDVQHDLGRFLDGKSSRYVNRLRFNNAFTAADSLPPVTDNYTDVSYHPITNVRREVIASGTFTQKEWLLKGRVYSEAVFEALCPALGKQFGFNIWKLWADRTQRALDKHMSQFDLKELTFSGNKEEAYTGTAVSVPSVPGLPKRQSAAGATISVTQTKQSNITPALIATLKQKIASLRGKLVANFKFDDLVTSINGVGPKAVKDLLDKLGRSDSDQLKSIITFKGLYWIMRQNQATFASLGLTESKRKLFEDTEAAFLKEDTTQKLQEELNACNTLLLDLEDNVRKNLSSGVYTFKGSNPVVIVDGNTTLFEYDGLEQYIENEIKVCTIPLFMFETMERMGIMLRDEFFKVNQSYNDFVRYLDQIYRVVTVSSDRTILLIDSDDNTFRVSLDDVEALSAAEKLAEQQRRDRDQTVNEEALALKRQESQDRTDQLQREQEERDRMKQEEVRQKAAELAEKQRLEREKEEELLQRQQEAAQAELEEAQKKLLGTQLDIGPQLSIGDWYPLSTKEDGKILFYVQKPAEEPSPAEEVLFETLQRAKSTQLTKMYYLPQQEGYDDDGRKTVLTIGGENYSFKFEEKGKLLVSEYGGKPLADSDDKVSKDVTPENISSIITSAIKAVKDLHKLGYYHGDIKLENLTLDNGTVKLIDYGATESFVSTDKYYKDKKVEIQGDLTQDNVAQWRQLWATNAQTNGDMIITPPLSGDVISKKIKQMSVMFNKDSSIELRLKLNDQWMLAHAMLHLGDKHMKPFVNPDIDEKQELAKLLFDYQYSSWFRQPSGVVGGNIRTADSKQAKEAAVQNRCIKPLKKLLRDNTNGNAKEIFKILYLVFQGGAKGKSVDEDMTLDTLKTFLTVQMTNDILVSLGSKWVSGHYNLVKLQKYNFKCPSLRTLNDENDDQPENIKFEGDIGTYLYGVPAKDIQKLFKPLYDNVTVKDGKAKFKKMKNGADKFTYQEKQSFFDYDSFSEGELNDLDAQMEAMDDDELERLISDEINVSYDSASDTGNSNAAYSYDSSSDTGNSHAYSYDSSSDTGNSNLAYNSESEHSASESMNDNAYNSDSDEDR